MIEQLIPWKRFWAPLGAALNLGDDGTGFLADPESELGKIWSPNTFCLDELHSLQCLVLCGEPGMGKTSALELARPQIIAAAGGEANLVWLRFRDVPDRGVFDELVFGSAKWKHWQSSGSAALTLLIDGLDEGLIRIPRFLEYLATRLSDVGVKRLNLRLICRVAEWPDTEGDRVLSLWGESKVPQIYELCPLRHRDALEGARFWGASPERFIEAVYERQIVSLAARPVTLRLLAREFERGKVLGRTRDEIYEVGCTRLCEEPDRARATALRRSGAVEPKFATPKIRRAASRIAALVLLSGKTGVFTGSPDDAPPGTLTLEEICGPDTDQLNLFATALATGLFTSVGSQRLGFAHQTFAEYLTAEFLSQMPLPQVRRLLCDRDNGREHLVPQLAEAAAWLTLRKPEFLEWVIQNEPESLLRADTSRLVPALKLQLVRSLLERAKREELFDERHSDRFYSSLAHPQLAQLLRPYITDASLNIVVRRMAIGIARACKLRELMDDLMVILKTEQGDSIRHFVAYALEELTPDARVSELIPLAKGEAGPDADDSLRGCALRRLVPAVWSVADAADALAWPGDANHFGSYHAALAYHLPQHLQPRDVHKLLKRLTEFDDCLDTCGFFRELSTHALIAGAKGLDSPAVDSAVVEFWIQQSRAHHHLTGHETREFVSFLQENPALRFRLAEKLLLAPSVTTDQVEKMAASGNLPLSGDDLEWMLQRLPQVTATRRAAWAMATQWYCRAPTIHRHWDLFLQRLDEVPELKAHFSWLRAWNLDEEIARKAKAQSLKWKRWEKQSQRPRPPSRAQRIQHDFDALALGEPRRWASLVWNLWLSDDGTRFESVEYDLTKSPGWKNSTSEQQQFFLTAAENFLLNCSDNGDYRQSAYPAVWAVSLLHDKVQSDQQLRSAIASRWIGAVFDGPSLGREFHQDLVAIAFALASRPSTDHLFKELDRQNAEHGDLLELHAFRKCWNADLSARLVAWMNCTPLKPKALGYCLSHLCLCDPPVAAKEIRSRLVPPPALTADSIPAVAEIADAALAYLHNDTWDFVWPIVQANDILAKDVIIKLSSNIRHSLRGDKAKWNEKQLADLYCLSRKFFPNEPQRRGGDYTPEMSADDLQRGLLGGLVAAASEEACKQLLRLANELPNERIWLRWRHMECLRAKRRVSWNPPPPGLVVELHSRAEARLVEDEDDLLEVVQESLDRFQKQITHTVNPEAEVFWHWDGADTKRHNFRPRDELFLSNRVAAWLRRDLVERKVVVGREVQPRTGKRTDIYLAAVPQPALGTNAREITVVIEVKGCWNQDVRTALEAQLVNDYLKPHSLTHGIYLVGWFVCPAWANPRNHLNATTFEHAQTEVAQLAFAYDGTANPEKVIGYVVDCQYPS